MRRQMPGCPDARMPERSDYLPSATARTARATAGAFGGSEWVCVDSARAGMDKPPGATPLPSYTSRVRSITLPKSRPMACGSP